VPGTGHNDPPFVIGVEALDFLFEALRERGYTPAVEPESFFVEGTPGPLEEGELERAAEWGRTLANKVSRAAVMI
jgi:hypothetical protein